MSAPAASASVARHLGAPRLHQRCIDSTNDRARALAAAGAPHGALVTADQQTAGRGRQGRTWTAPLRQALLMSVVLRDPPTLLPLAAAVAVAEAVDRWSRAGAAQIKWPNDVLIERRKVAGILVEGRPQEGWAVLGVGLNVAVALDELPADLRGRAGSLQLGAEAIEPALESVLGALERWLVARDAAVLEAWRERDALRGRDITWAGGEGRAEGIDGEGRLVVRLAEGGHTALDSGEVHLTA